MTSTHSWLEVGEQFCETCRLSEGSMNYRITVLLYRYGFSKPAIDEFIFISAGVFLFVIRHKIERKIAIKDNETRNGTDISEFLEFIREYLYNILFWKLFSFLYNTDT